MSISAKGKTKSKEWREKLSKANIGKKASEETKIKMRNSNKSKIITARPIACYDYYSSEFIANFYSIRDAAMQLDCKETSICNNLHNRSNSFNSKTLNKRLKCQKI